jgi:thymidine phosphorylase
MISGANEGEPVKASERERPPAGGGQDRQGRLVAKPLQVDTLRENVVLLSRDCTVLRPGRLLGQRRVEVRGDGRRLLASPIICDDPSLVGPDEIGLPEPLRHRLGAAPGDLIEIMPARPPRTLDYVRAKAGGATLDQAQFNEIAVDLANHRWSDMEVAAFLMACASFMTPEETLAMTRAMVSAGDTLKWSHPLIVDKHCIGGVPGNRTSLIVAPIVAAHGLKMPKTSSRAITSPAGTADTMEVLARVDLNESEMRDVVETCGACVVWGGRVNLSPADDVMISVERPLSIDTPDQLVASILSKKIAAGARHLVIDVPVGPTAKVRDASAALYLRKLFEFVARRVGLSLDVVLTDGSQPIGRGVGPVLEARDVLAVLENRAEAPLDLRDKAIMLAGRVLESDPDMPLGAGERRARELLADGSARRKLDEIIRAQGPSPVASKTGPLVHEVVSSCDGRIASIDCQRIAGIARLAGAPDDPGAGVDLLYKVGDTVRAGAPLYRIHGSEPSEFRFAIEASDEDCGVKAVS